MNRFLVRNGSRVSLLGFAILALLIHFSASNAHSAQPVASLTEFSGTVIIQSQGDWGVKPQKGLALYSMDKVVTRTGTAVVTFNDGAVMEIKANSNLLIEEQEKTGTVTRNLRLLLGKLLFRSGKGSSTKTNLQTPTAVAGLRGTAGTLSIGVDGASYIHFTEGGTSYTVGEFISGVAKDVPSELADLNPAQRAAFVASAAADQAKKAEQDLKDGKISDPQAALAAAEAAKAAGQEAKAAAEAMLNNPDPNVRSQAQQALDAANKAIEAAKQAEDAAKAKGATSQAPGTYTPPAETQQIIFNVVPPPVQPPTIPQPIPNGGGPAGGGSSGNLFNIPISPDSGFLSIGTLSGSSTDGENTLTLTGNYEGSLAARSAISLGGTMSDGSQLQGFLAGVAGSWRGSLDSIYVGPDGSAGFLKSSLNGTAEGGALNATGDLVRGETLGAASLGPEGLVLEDLSSLNLPIARFDTLLINGNKGYSETPAGSTDPGIQYHAHPEEVRGIYLTDPNNRILSVWRYGEEISDFERPSTLGGKIGIVGYEDPSHLFYMMGQVNGNVDGDQSGHVNLSGELDYLDPHYVGKYSFEYNASYNGSDAQVAGTGTYVLDPLALYGYSMGTLYSNQDVSQPESFLIGGGGPVFSLPWENPTTTFVYMGQYYQPSLDAGTYHLQNSYLMTGEGSQIFSGYMAGIWDEENLSGSSYALYLSPEDRKAGLLKGFRTVSGYHFVAQEESEYRVGMWKTDGTWSRIEKGLPDDGYQYEIANEYLSDVRMNGKFFGIDSSSIQGSGDGDWGGEISFLAQQGGEGPSLPWGIYNLGLSSETTYSGKPSGEAIWDGKIGGSGVFGYASNGSPDGGYWLADVGGTWSADGKIQGVLSGDYLTERQMGTIYGDFTGLANGETWVGQSVGTFEGGLLTSSGYTRGALKYYDGGYGDLAEGGYANGLVGSIDLLFSGNAAHTLMMGTFQNENPTIPVLLYGSGWYLDGGSVNGNERYNGYMVGTWADGSINAEVRALYIDSNGKAGYISGNPKGTYSDDLGMWKIAGDLAAHEMGSTNVSPEELNSHIITETFYSLGDYRGEDIQTGSGAFSGGGTISVYSAAGDPMRIDDQNWGIWNAGFGGRYDGNSSGAGKVDLGGSYGDYDEAYWVGHITDLQFGEKDLTGKYSARALTPNELITFDGKILGSHWTGDGGFWQAAGIGTFTSEPLAWNGSMGGSIYSNTGSGEVWGLMGGLNLPWDQATSTFVGMGPFTLQEEVPENNYLFTAATWGTALNEHSGLNGYVAATLGSGSVNGSAVGMYWTEDGRAGLLKGYGQYGSVLGNYFQTPDGVGMWEMDGSWTRIEKDVPPLGTGEWYEPMDGQFSNVVMKGKFNGQESVILGGGVYDSGIQFLRHSLDGYSDGSLPWGIYALILDNNSSYSGKPEAGGDWSAKIGGWGAFGYSDAAGSDEGYWLADVGGTWSADGKIKGNLSGRYLTLYQTGVMEGDFTGMDGGADSSTWMGQSIGTFEGERLAWSGNWNATSLLYNSGGGIEWAGYDGSGLFGLTPRDGGYHLYVMGEYDEDGSGVMGNGPYVWSTSISGGQVIDYSNANGGLEGFTAGSWKKNNALDSFGSMNGYAAAIYYGNDGRVGLFSGNLAGNFSEFENYEPGSWGMFGAEGDMVTKRESQLTGADIWIDYGDVSTAYLAGQFGADPESGIYGSKYNGKTKFIAYDSADGSGSLPWGIYNLKMGSFDEPFGYFNKPDPAVNPNPAWTAAIGGRAYFGYNEGDYGFWLAGLDGKWYGDGTMDGSLSGRYLTRTQMGTIGGPFYGLYTEEGTEGGKGYGSWVGVSVGTFEGSPLAWSGDVGTGSIYRLSSGDYLSPAGDNDGLIGGVNLPWSEVADKKFVAMGEYSLSDRGADAYLWQSEFFANALSGEGSVQGSVGAVWNDNALQGASVGLYYVPDGGTGVRAGILLSNDLTGKSYRMNSSGEETEYGMWDLEGTFIDVPIPATLDPSGISFETNHDLQWSGLGSFNPDGYIYVASNDGVRISIANQDWGVWQSVLGGSYFGTPSDSWSMSLINHGAGGANVWVNVEGSKWSDNQILGKASGAWVNWDKAVTGVMGGELKGTFNPTDATSGTWLSVASGAYLETSQFMDMIARGQTDALQKLNIPCAEIGKATLSGSSELLNVHMNDVTFFAYRSGGDPKIWATKDVGGTFNGIPGTGHQVGLSGGGLNANFTVNNWADSKWGANIAGSGALNRTDVGGNVNVNFQGNAAGNYTGTTSGNFSGAGSGTASKQ